MGRALNPKTIKHNNKRENNPYKKTETNQQSISLVMRLALFTHIRKTDLKKLSKIGLLYCITIFLKYY